MYNHYIPQSDGSYRRNSVSEPTRRPQRPSDPPPQKPKPEPECKPTPPPQNPKPPEKCIETSQDSPLTFLRKLLPKELDISDLIIIGLLLLLSGDDCENDLSPLLTIALYFLL